MTVPHIRHILLPLLLACVFATGVTFLPSSLGLAGRWVVSAILATYLLLASRVLGRVATPVVLATAAYVAWCAFTGFWSDVPSLSWSKAGALALTSFAALWGGHEWSLAHPRRQALAWLFPCAVLTLVAGVAGGDGTEFLAGTGVLYAGATANPNFLGVMVAISFPALLLSAYDATRKRLLWALAVLSAVVMLYLTASRGAYLILFGTLGGFLLAHRPRRSLMLVFGMLWAVALAALLVPDLAGEWVQRNVYKEADPQQGVFFRRELVWADSYEAAIAGGATGLGFGVSLGGDTTQLRSGIDAQYYSREKGSSQLAVVEELGLVGLGFYLLLMVVMFRWLVVDFWRFPDRELRVARGIVIGTLAGMLLQSTLEAWWVSPGSPESISFWAMAGTGLGLARMGAQEPFARRRPPAPRRPRAASRL
jgi:hypothetical protein